MTGGDVPRVSVIVPFYRAAPYIERCLDALLAQDYPREHFELLFVDNNSRDGSSDVLRRCTGVTILHEPRQGAYAARNRGVRHASGDIVAFTDADCVPRRDWLSRLAAALRDPQVHMVFGAARPGGQSHVVRLVGSYEDSKERYILGGREPRLYVGHAGNMAVRKPVLDEFGPFLEHARGSDTAFVRRVVDATSCGAVQYVPEAEVCHLEVVRLRDYFRKVFVYGQTWQQHRRVSGNRPLSTRERLDVFHATVAREALSGLDAAILLSTLVLGVCYWYAGATVAMSAVRGAASLSTSRT